jgi:hypothetical protein
MDFSFIVLTAILTTTASTTAPRMVSVLKRTPEGDYKLDNINGIIRPVGWMNSSARLIATVENNLVFGTDIENVQVAASVRRNIIEARPMMAAGTQIQDLAAIFVNDQA